MQLMVYDGMKFIFLTIVERLCRILANCLKISVKEFNICKVASKLKNELPH